MPPPSLFSHSEEREPAGSYFQRVRVLLYAVFLFEIQFFGLEEKE
jgi:hypothetical protein